MPGRSIKTVPFLMMRYTGQLEDVEVLAPHRRDAAPPTTCAAIFAEFEAVYAKVNHRVSRYGEAGFTITELGLIATADKVKPVLVKRPLGKSDPAAAHKGVREAYIGGRWHKADLYEMDLLQPGHEVIGPAIVEHPATTLVVHPGRPRLPRRVDASPLQARAIAMLDKPAASPRERLLESERADGSDGML